jgi:hypothetical protein
MIVLCHEITHRNDLCPAGMGRAVLVYCPVDGNNVAGQSRLLRDKL